MPDIPARFIIFWMISTSALAQTIAIPALQPRSAPVYSGDIQITVSFQQANPQSVVLWNGARLATRSSSSELNAIVPAANLQHLGYSEVAVYDPVTGVTSPPAYFYTFVPLATNAITFDAVRNLIYCSVPSTAPRYGNSIVAVDPDTGDVAKNVFIGSEPNQLALSDDARYLYVALDGASAIRRLNLDTFQPEIQFPIDQGQTPNLIGGYGLFVADMKVVPGSPNSVVISRRYNGLSPDYAGTAAYDNGVIRQKVTPTHTGSRKFAFGASSSTLWGLVNGFGMQRLILDSTGVSIASGNQFSADINGVSGNDIKFDNGLFYLDSGAVIDPNLRSAVGKFAGSGPVQPDSSRGRAFIMSGSIGGITTLQSFDLKTFVPFGSLPVPDSIGAGLLRWGTNGIAMQGGASYYFDNSNNGKLFIFRTPMADAAPSVSAGAIVNAASQTAGPIAPGEILSIYGGQLGPSGGAGLRLDRAGHVANTLSGIQVLFDSTPGTLTYAGPNQINVIAPYSIGRRSSVSVVVTNTGIPSEAVTMQVAAASPAVFTADGSGKGAGAISNQDGSPNSVSNPATAGSVIVLFGTGEGLTNPAGTDGKVTAGTPPLPVTPLTATVDGIEAAVQYGGAAPGMVSGVFQMNLIIPADVHPGPAVPLVIKSGALSSPPVTVAVK